MRVLAWAAITTTIAIAPSAALVVVVSCTPFSGVADGSDAGAENPEVSAADAATADAPFGNDGESAQLLPCVAIDGGVCTITCGIEFCESCKAIHATNPTTASGNFLIRTVEPGPPNVVYCDMATDGGGWTLIARSTVGGDSDAFGWESGTGSAQNDTSPYSLSTLVLKERPSELLFGAWSSGKQWGPNVYKMELPSDFVAENHDKAIEPMRTSVAGTCDGGLMHRFIGFTDQSDVFFFRDTSKDTAIFGLMADGWHSNGTNGGNPCDYSSMLDETQGMLMVR